MKESRQKWVNFLCQQGNEIEYLEERHVSMLGDVEAIMEYRKTLRERRNCSLLFARLESEWALENWSSVKSLVEIIFLEPIANSQIKQLNRKLKESKGNISVLHNIYKNNRDIRFVTAIRKLQ